MQQNTIKVCDDLAPLADDLAPLECDYLPPLELDAVTLEPLQEEGMQRLREEKCKNLIRALPMLTYYARNPEDIDPACEEHAVKALIYGLTRSKVSGGMVKIRWAH